MIEQPRCCRCHAPLNLAEEENLIEQKLNRIREQRREIINRSDANKVKV